MSESRLVFKHCAEALLRGLGPRLTPTLKTRLEQQGLGGANELPPAFEYERWQQILSAAAAELSPADLKAGHFTLGELITDAYLENFIGMALKPVIKLIGMRRALGRMKQNFRVANNYSEVEVSDVGPGHVHLRVNETGDMAAFYRGILARGLELTLAPKGLEVDIVEEAADAVVYSVRWAA